MKSFLYNAESLTDHSTSSVRFAIAFPYTGTVYCARKMHKIFVARPNLFSKMLLSQQNRSS